MVELERRSTSKRPPWFVPLVLTLAVLLTLFASFAAVQRTAGDGDFSSFDLWNRLLSSSDSDASPSASLTRRLPQQLTFKPGDTPTLSTPQTSPSPSPSPSPSSPVTQPLLPPPPCAAAVTLEIDGGSQSASAELLSLSSSPLSLPSLPSLSPSLLPSSLNPYLPGAALNFSYWSSHASETTPLVYHNATLTLTPHPVTATCALTGPFAAVQRRFPHALTLNPQVDCERGRYFIMQNWHQDGFGSTVGMYHHVLALSVYLNLTLITPPMAVLHAEDEGLDARMRSLGTTNFDLSHAAYDTCPHSSPVRTNSRTIGNMGTFKYHNLTRHLDFDPDNSYLAGLLEWLQGMGPDVGLTVLHSYGTEMWWGKGLALPTLALVVEVRFHVLHPFIPFQSALPPNGHLMTLLPTVQQVEATTASILVAVHVRRGDIMQDADPNFVNGFWNDRFTTFDAIAGIMAEVRDFTPAELQPRLHFTIYSEGVVERFTVLFMLLESRGIRSNLVLNGPTTTVLSHLASADILIGAHSALSYAAASLNSQSVKVLPSGGTEIMPVGGMSAKFLFIRNAIRVYYEVHNPRKDQWTDLFNIPANLMTPNWTILDPDDFGQRVALMERKKRRQHSLDATSFDFLAEHEQPYPLPWLYEYHLYHKI